MEENIGHDTMDTVTKGEGRQSKAMKDVITIQRKPPGSRTGASRKSPAAQSRK